MTIGVSKDLSDSILDITIRQTSYQVNLKSSRMSAYPLGQHFGGRFFSSDSIGFVVATSLAPNACSYLGKKN
jgi:hypothetical protein